MHTFGKMELLDLPHGAFLTKQRRGREPHTVHFVVNPPGLDKFKVSAPVHAPLLVLQHLD